MSVTNGYTTVDKLKAQLNVTDSRWDTALELAVNAASRQIDAHTGWVQHGFWQDGTVVARTYEPDETKCLYIPEGISTTTGLIVKVDYGDDGTYESTLTISTDFTLEPVNAAADYPVRPYTEIEIRNTSAAYFPLEYYSVQVTAKFGWPAVPAAVELACLIQAAQLYKAGDATFGVLQLTGLDGSAVRIGGSLHPQAEALLVDYSKPRVG